VLVINHLSFYSVRERMEVMCFREQRDKKEQSKLDTGYDLEDTVTK
jgi:hypothetical protein